MPSRNPFKRSNHSQMGSTYLTDANQGGGDKKAGFPYQVGRIYGVSLILNPGIGKCCSLTSWNNNLFPLARQSRPITTMANTNYAYWHIPGTGNQ